MKGFFKDSKEWDIIVWGDWRDSKGKVRKYNEGYKKIHITGGVGFYYFFKGCFPLSIYFFKQDLLIIKQLEKEEKRKFHKGLFYYQIALSYKNMNEKKEYRKWLYKAQKEDIRNYGEKAKTFPSFTYR